MRHPTEGNSLVLLSASNVVWFWESQYYDEKDRKQNYAGKDTAGRYRYYNKNIMSHILNDDTLINTTLRQVLSASDKVSEQYLSDKTTAQRRQSRHSEPTVEINHPIESGIVPNIDDYYDNNSETEEIIFPFGSEQDIDLESLGSDNY